MLLCYMRQPSSETLYRYAEILIWFALWSESWIKAWDVVLIQVPECAKAMILPLQTAVMKRWWHPLIRFYPDGIIRNFFELANDEQLKYKPKHEMLWRVDDIDHLVSIIADADKHELEWIDPKKIMMSSKETKFYRDAMDAKENKGDFTWTLWLFWTPQMAEEVWLSLEEYRNQIIKACYLDEENPIEKRQQLSNDISHVKDHLNSLPIQWLHVKWQDIDLKVQLGKNRQRLWGTWRNIPSFEVFISPDRRWTEWWYKCNQPLYRYGSLITWIELRFSWWKVVESRASQHEQLLKEMIATENADRIWEFSLTDTRFSRIDTFMWETLYDENMWWPFWNTHIALWNAYKDSFPWDVSSVTPDQRFQMWYNESVVHTDIVSTSDRTVVATMTDGSEQVIYQWGKFTFL